jgi:hypothetical protein
MLAIVRDYVLSCLGVYELVVLRRTLSGTEVNRNARTVGYPFGFLQVKLNENAEGTGYIMSAAKIRLDKKRVISRLRAMAICTLRRLMSAR